MKPKSVHRRSRFARVALETVWIVSLVTAGLVLGFFVVYRFGTPSVDDIARFPFHEATILYDESGTVELYRVYGEENRRVIPRSEIPRAVRLATIAAEDERFFEHAGIDPIAIFRAALANLEGGGIREGGSTITQQLARTLFLTRERTLKRKLLEAVLAVKINHRFDKNTVLDLYLNAVPYGANAYGIEAAAGTYFGKRARDLTLDEAALLAALPNAPTFYSPYGANRESLLARRNEILSRMSEHGLAAKHLVSDALATDTLAKIAPRRQPIRAPHFVMHALDELDTHYGRAVLETGGFSVITTIDLDLQASAEQAVANGVVRNRSRGAENASLVALDPRDGRILAMVGSRNFFDPQFDGQVNVTIEARQPGSAFKPFAYATAFEKGYEPESLVLDAPTNFGPDGSGKDYVPQNYDGRFHGLLTFRQALSMSLNVPAVQVLEAAGVEDTIDLAERLGITTLGDSKRYGLALVLGGAEVRPLDMASAFGVFSQEGVRHPARAIERISDRNGTIQSYAASDGTAVLDPEIARRINSILSDNNARTPIFGARSPLAFPPGVTVAAKTGTTQSFRDAWTVGYTPNVAVAVWAGNNDNRPMRAGADGVFVAAPLWREFMDAALKRFPETGFVAYTPRSGERRSLRNAFPSGKTIYVDKRSGKQISKEKARKLKKKYVETFELPEEVVALPDEQRIPLSNGEPS